MYACVCVCVPSALQQCGRPTLSLSRAALLFSTDTTRSGLEDAGAAGAGAAAAAGAAGTAGAAATGVAAAAAAGAAGAGVGAVAAGAAAGASRVAVAASAGASLPFLLLQAQSTAVRQTLSR